MVSTGLKYYIAFAAPAAVSFLGSAAVIATYFKFPQLRKGAVYKHVISLHIADMIQCASWFLGTKYHSTGSNRFVCVLQEYTFQYGSLCKAFWACAICLMTYESLTAMTLTEGSYLKKCIACFGIPVPIVAISGYYATHELFCGGNFHSTLDRDKEWAYLITFIGTLYTAILVNVIVMYLIYRKIQNLYCTMSSRSSGESSQARLLAMCKVLSLYPIVNSIAWAPEVTFLFTRSIELGIFTGVSVNSSGIWFALIFFLSNKSAKRCWFGYFCSKASSVRSIIGISSSLDTRQSTAEGSGVLSTELSGASYAMSTTTITSTVLDDNVMMFNNRNISTDGRSNLLDKQFVAISSS